MRERVVDTSQGAYFLIYIQAIEWDGWGCQGPGSGLSKKFQSERSYGQSHKGVKLGPTVRSDRTENRSESDTKTENGCGHHRVNESQQVRTVRELPYCNPYKEAQLQRL